MQPREPYNSDVSDRQWKILCPFFPEKGRLGRPPRYEKREGFNAIQCVTKTGCAWRDVPHDLPPWRLVYQCFSKWQKLGLWQKFNDALRDKVRAKHGKKAPTAGILDSQTVKMADQPGERSYDAGKKVVGRKGHLLVDTLGLVLVAVVHGAGIQDRDGARIVLEKALIFGWLRVVFADGGYAASW